MSVQIRVSGDRITVALWGWDAVWSLKRSIEIPVESLQSATVVEDPFADRWRGLRLPGTSVPGYRAGSYRGRSEWRFYLARVGQPALDMELSGHRYARIIIRVDDPDIARAVLAGVMEDPNGSVSSSSGL